MTEQKLKELLADMTLEEKVNQMSQVVGAFFNKDMDITAMGPMADKGFTPENVALSGSILGSMGAETLKKIQKDFVEQHPHHIPMLFMLEIDGKCHQPGSYYDQKIIQIPVLFFHKTHKVILSFFTAIPGISVLKCPQYFYSAVKIPEML